MRSDGSTAANMLDGLVVAEIGDRVAVGALGSLLADLGATVVLFEPESHGFEEKWAARGLMAAGKQSLSFDAEHPSDRARDMISRADIVLLSSDRSRFEASLWEAARPSGQILCDITAYGHSGPLAGLPDSEALVQARSGVAHTTGRRDGAPVVSGAPFLSMETAAYALSAILVAEGERAVSGRGQRIDMALYDIGVNALLTFIPLVQTGRPALRSGNRHPTLAPWNAYRALDGWVLICGPTNDQWSRLCTAMQRPDLRGDARFATPTLRFENVEAIDAEIGAWVADLAAEECIARVAAQGIPCSPIVELADLPREPNLVHRRSVVAVQDSWTGSTLTMPISPIRLAGAPVRSTKPVPFPGSADAPDGEPRRDERRHGDVAIGRRPLEGLRIVEIGMNTVAPLACRQLGALGADVIKVEPPAGDSNRVNAPLRADGESYVFALSNTDKRGVVLDLKEPADVARLWQLLATADAVMENLKPGSLERLGFGANAVRTRFPSIIYCSVNGFGYDSAYPGRPALDTVIQGMSGAMSATLVDGVPTKAGISISDQLGGQFGLAGILAALRRRRITGEGAHLDISMQDCTAWATQVAWNGGGADAWKAVAAADGYVVLHGPRDSLAGFAAVEGEAAADLLQRAADAGIAAAPVASVEDVVADAHTQARGLLEQVPTIDGSAWTVLGCPLKLLSSPVAVRSAMPRLGFADPGLSAEFGWEAQPERQRLLARG